MAVTEIAPETAQVAPDPKVGPRPGPTALEGVLGSGDHKTVGRIFIGGSLAFLALNLLFSALAHLDIAAGSDLLGYQVTDRLLANHALGLVLCGVLPLFVGLGTFLVPLQVGAPTISFPRAAAAAMWAWLLGSVLFSVAVIVKGSYGGSNEAMSRLGNVSLGLVTLALMVAIVCVTTTVLSLRAPGMTVARTPFFSFSMLVAGAVWLGTLPAVFAGVALWQIRHASATDLFTGNATSEWLFHQPAIWLVAVPALGILLDLASVSSGRRVRFATALQYAIIGSGALSFGTWAQFPFSRETFVWILGSVLVGLPLIVVLGGVADTVRLGTPKPSPALLQVVAASPLLLLAAAAAALQGLSTAGGGNLVDLAVGGFATVTDRTKLTAEAGPGIAVGQAYLIVATVAVVGVAACFAWGSRLFAGGLPSGAGKVMAPIGLLGGLLLGAVHVIIGIARPDADALKVFAGIAGAGALLLALFVLGGLAALVVAAARRRGAGSEHPAPQGGTLEWLTASPPAAGNFTEDLPQVESGWPLFDRAETGGNA